MTFIDSIRRLALVRASIYAEVSYDDTKLTSGEQKIWTIPPLGIIGFFVLLGLVICYGVIRTIGKNKQSQT